MALISRFSLHTSIALALVLISITTFLFSPNDHINRGELLRILHSQEEEASQIIQQLYRGKKTAFVDTALNSEIDGPFDSRALKSLCQRTKWTENLIISCGAPQGGVGNVRNVFLNCVRYAIEAGGFVIPEINVRSQKDLSELAINRIMDFDYLFDREHFVKSLEDACPKMKVWGDINDLYNIPSTADALILLPQSLARTFVHGVVLGEPSEWRKSFDQWVLDHTTPQNRHQPLLVDFTTPLLQWPVSYDGEAVARTFGRILRFREDTRRLAAVVLHELSKKYSLNIKPRVSFSKHTFYGAHLRTAYDAIKAGWPGYNMQAPAYIAQAIEFRLPVIYVTSESPEDVERFRADTAALNLTMATKVDLLTGADLLELQALTWDQQALVDYEVLLKCSKFGGIDKSSFAWNIALRRHILTGESGEAYLERDQTLIDEYSTLMGLPGSMAKIPASMWP